MAQKGALNLDWDRIPDFMANNPRTGPSVRIQSFNFLPVGEEDEKRELSSYKRFLQRAFQFFKRSDPRFTRIQEKKGLIKALQASYLNAEFELKKSDLDELLDFDDDVILEQFNIDVLMKYFASREMDRLVLLPNIRDNLITLKKYIISTARNHMILAKMQISGIQTEDQLRFLFYIIIGKYDIGLYEVNADDEAIFRRKSFLQTENKRTRNVSEGDRIKELYKQRKDYLVAEFPVLFGPDSYFGKDIWRIAHTFHEMTRITLLETNVPFHDDFQIYMPINDRDPIVANAEETNEDEKSEEVTNSDSVEGEELTANEMEAGTIAGDMYRKNLKDEREEEEKDEKGKEEKVEQQLEEKVEQQLEKKAEEQQLKVKVEESTAEMEALKELERKERLVAAYQQTKLDKIANEKKDTVVSYVNAKMLTKWVKEFEQLHSITPGLTDEEIHAAFIATTIPTIDFKGSEQHRDEFKFYRKLKQNGTSSKSLISPGGKVYNPAEYNLQIRAEDEKKNQIEFSKRSPVDFPIKNVGNKQYNKFSKWIAEYENAKYGDSNEARRLDEGEREMAFKEYAQNKLLPDIKNERKSSDVFYKEIYEIIERKRKTDENPLTATVEVPLTGTVPLEPTIIPKRKNKIGKGKSPNSSQFKREEEKN
jgi:hypothetical protein